MFCNKCGAQIEDGAKFCGVCGAPVEIQPKSASDPNPGQQQYQPVPVQTVPEELYYADDDAAVFSSVQQRAVVRIFAIGSYLFLPLLILTAIFFKDKKYMMQHANNALVLTILFAAASILVVIPFLGWITMPPVIIFCTVIMILAIIRAAKGTSYTMPIIGRIRILKGNY